MAKKKPIAAEEELADIAWEGDSREVLASFPKPVRQELGEDLFRMQAGEQPYSSRPMKSIGQGVYELKQQDARAWYRVIYLARVEDTIYVLHSFEKQSNKTSPKDIAVAEGRLKVVKQRLLAAKKRDKNG